MCRYGGALDIQAPCAVSLADCAFRRNTAVTGGGALALSGLGSPTYLALTRTVFSNNDARAGADLVQTSANATVLVAAGANGTRVSQLQGDQVGRVRYSPTAVLAAAAAAPVVLVADRVRVNGVAYPALLTGEEPWLLEAKQVCSRSKHASSKCWLIMQLPAGMSKCWCDLHAAACAHP